MTILILFFLYSIGLVRPKLWRWSLIGSSVVLLFLGNRLARDTGIAWTDGTGILRGIRMGFCQLPEFGEVAAWEPLGLIFGGLFLLTIASMQIEQRARRGIIIGTLSLLGVLLSNSVHGIMLFWSAAVALAVWTSAEERANRLPRWVASGVAALCVGIVFCAILAYVQLDRLYGAHGVAGLLDMGGLARLRHLRISSPFANGPPLVSILPLVLAGASVSAAIMYELSRPFLCMAGAVVGTALILKLYPLAELGIRDGSGLGVGLVLWGVFVMIWAGLRTAPARRRLLLICCGGAMVLLGAKMPIGAIAWTLLWVPVLSMDGRRLDRASVIAVAGSVIVLAPLWQWMGRQGPFLAALCALATVAVGLVVPIGNARSWWSRGSVCGIIPLVLSLPPLSVSFWVFWTGKVRISATSAVTPWLAAALAVLFGIAVQWKGQRLVLSGVRGQIDRFAERVALTARVWMGPVIDTMSVIWLAAERFLWQGVTLWLPRRFLQWVAIHVEWLQRVPLPSLRRVPLDVIAMGGTVARTMTTSSRAIVAVLAAFLLVVWVLSGVIP